jgi:hypothetical protein
LICEFPNSFFFVVMSIPQWQILHFLFIARKIAVKHYGIYERFRRLYACATKILKNTDELISLPMRHTRCSVRMPFRRSKYIGRFRHLIWDSCPEMIFLTDACSYEFAEAHAPCLKNYAWYGSIAKGSSHSNHKLDNALCKTFARSHSFLPVLRISPQATTGNHNDFTLYGNRTDPETPFSWKGTNERLRNLCSCILPCCSIVHTPDGFQIITGFYFDSGPPRCYRMWCLQYFLTIDPGFPFTNWPWMQKCFLFLRFHMVINEILSEQRSRKNPTDLTHPTRMRRTKSKYNYLPGNAHRSIGISTAWHGRFNYGVQMSPYLRLDTIFAFCHIIKLCNIRELNCLDITLRHRLGCRDRQRATLDFCR